MDWNPSLPLNRQIALFDSDCLEPMGEGGFPLPALPAFSVRERMRPKADRIDALYAFVWFAAPLVLFDKMKRMWVLFWLKRKNLSHTSH